MIRGAARREFAATRRVVRGAGRAKIPRGATALTHLLAAMDGVSSGVPTPVPVAAIVPLATAERRAEKDRSAERVDVFVAVADEDVRTAGPTSPLASVTTSAAAAARTAAAAMSAHSGPRIARARRAGRRARGVRVRVEVRNRHGTQLET